MIMGANIDTLLGLGLGLGLGLRLGLEFPYVQTRDVCKYPHYFQATRDLQPIKSQVVRQ